MIHINETDSIKKIFYKNKKYLIKPYTMIIIQKNGFYEYKDINKKNIIENLKIEFDKTNEEENENKQIIKNSKSKKEKEKNI